MILDVSRIGIDTMLSNQPLSAGQIMEPKRISVAPVQRLAEEKGIKNPSQLAAVTGITKPTAGRYWHDDESLRVLDISVLEAIAVYLECEPGDLIEWKRVKT